MAPASDQGCLGGGGRALLLGARNLSLSGNPEQWTFVPPPSFSRVSRVQS